jgi:exodeoxyribonuclease VII large subunit
MEAVAVGRITTYPGKSGYQIIVEALEPAGAGALLAMLEERKKKLAAEGLFDAARKKPLPFLPGTIGVITSPTGAVIRDILHRLAARFPRRVLVWPVSVQGEKAAGEVAAAIKGFNAMAGGADLPRPDVLIVARGGGSIEDLWAFNEEIVVRAAAASAIPLISAVGHETDTTLIDYASDVRAPTPSAAAEMAVPVRVDLVRQVQGLDLRLSGAVMRRAELARQRVRDVARGLPAGERLFEMPRQRLDGASARLGGALTLGLQRWSGRLGTAVAKLSFEPWRQALARHRQRLAELDGRSALAMERRGRERALAVAAAGKLLDTLGHTATLARGFALVRTQAGAVVRSARALEPGQSLSLAFADGEAAVRVEGDAPPKAAKAKAAPKQGGKDQGDLF